MTAEQKQLNTALIVGASGLVGKSLLTILLESDYYDKITILVRKVLPIQHSKLQQVIFDFDKSDSFLPKADHIYCCLGTTIKKAGTKENFVKVDLDYPLMIARAAQNQGAKKFALVSAMGSNENSTFFYSQVKGEVERKIQNVPFETTLIVRPSLLLGKREEFRFGEMAGKFFMLAFGFIVPKNWKAIHSSKVARCMFAALKGEDKGLVIKNSGEMQSY